LNASADVSMCICVECSLVTLQERDGYRDQVVSLRDKVSGLARSLASEEDASQAMIAHMGDLEKELAATSQQVSDVRDDLRKESEELAALQQSARKAAATARWQQMKLTTQRDGYKGQVEVLRDKVWFLQSKAVTLARQRVGPRFTCTPAWQGMQSTHVTLPLAFPLLAVGENVYEGTRSAPTRHSCCADCGAVTPTSRGHRCP
jgi:hypothetical protein